MQQDSLGRLSFTTPEPGTADSVTVVNGTIIRQDVALGFLPDPAFSPVPVFYWSGLGSGASIQTNFQPVLRAYITSQYTDDQIVRGEISAPIIFEQNLAALSDVTVWDLRFDAATGRFSITQA
ncbi:hypothetical protein EV363DRAFT_1453877 [Boletus edulis]|nr:hypothetical protein EV363DRAFT_1453877 [Boletus edulis]